MIKKILKNEMRKIVEKKTTKYYEAMRTIVFRAVIVDSGWRMVVCSSLRNQ